MTIRTSLSRAPSSAMTEDDKRSLAKTAWHKPGPVENVWACVRLGDVIGWDVRETIVQELIRQYGRRLGK